MTHVAILPVPTENGGLSYRGVSGDIRSEGRTPGEALDALTRQLVGDGTGTDAALLIVVQGLRPDHGGPGRAGPPGHEQPDPTERPASVDATRAVPIGTEEAPSAMTLGANPYDSHS